MYKLSNLFFAVDEAKPNFLSGFKDENTSLKFQTPLAHYYPQEIHQVHVTENYIFVLFGKQKNSIENQRVIHSFESLNLDIKCLSDYSTVFTMKEIKYFPEFQFKVPLGNEHLFGLNFKDQGVIRITNFRQKAESILDLHKNDHRVMLFEFSNDGKLVASLSKGTVLKITNVETK